MCWQPLQWGTGFLGPGRQVIRHRAAVAATGLVRKSGICSLRSLSRPHLSASDSKPELQAESGSPGLLVTAVNAGSFSNLKTENLRLRLGVPSTSIAKNRQWISSLGLSHYPWCWLLLPLLGASAKRSDGGNLICVLNAFRVQIACFSYITWSIHISTALSDLKFKIHHHCFSISLVFVFIWSKLIYAGQLIYQVE